MNDTFKENVQMETKKHKIFESGEIYAEAYDPESDKISLKICIPNCLLQTLSPILLGKGVISDLELRNPLSIWIPKLSLNRFSPNITNRNPDIDEIFNQIIVRNCEETLRTFKELGEALINPTDIIPMLPLGIYVTIRYRTTLTDFVIPSLQNINTMQEIIGIQQFCAAASDVVAEVLAKHSLYSLV